MNKSWTSDHLAYLKKHYPTGKLKDIQFHLKKTRPAIYRMAGLLGLKRTVILHLDSWTAKEDDALTELFPFTKNTEVANILGKTVSSIRNRSNILGLKKANRYWTKEQEDYVLTYYNHFLISELVINVNKSKWAVINKYRELTNKKAKST